VPLVVLFELGMLSAANATPPAIIRLAAVAASKVRKFMNFSRMKTLPAGCRVARIIRPTAAGGYIGYIGRCIVSTGWREC